MSDRSRRRLAIAAFAVLIVTAAALAIGGTVVYAYHCLDGDGGFPYVARDSAQKDVCGATRNGLWLLLLAGVLIGVASHLCWRAVGGWLAGRGGVALVVALGLAIPLAPVATFTAASLPSDRCTDEQLVEWRQWREAGQRGDPPHDCDVY